mmetsp:Transcript_53058/g.164816  ORF Transcript_53058/g.164816 Transcript_53058/m.164816 type:complete len:213 (-) Transcript_53058:514-1152(-)
MGELVLVQGSAACECGGDTATSDGLLRTGPVSADAWSRYEGASGSASCGGDRSLPALDRRTCEVILTEPLDRRTGTGMLGLVARWLAPRTGVQGQGGCCCCCGCEGAEVVPAGAGLPCAGAGRVPPAAAGAGGPGPCGGGPSNDPGAADGHCASGEPPSERARECGTAGRASGCGRYTRAVTSSRTSATSMSTTSVIRLRTCSRPCHAERET